MTTARDLAVLFAGRDDMYGRGDEKPYCIKESPTEQVWDAHLRWGKQHAIGIYNRIDDDLVHWGCSDFDDPYDSVQHATDVQRALRLLGIPSYQEISRSARRHLWVFTPMNAWIPAADMRRAFLLAHHLADVPAREVNPKSTGGTVRHDHDCPNLLAGRLPGGGGVLHTPQPQPEAQGAPEHPRPGGLDRPGVAGEVSGVVGGPGQGLRSVRQSPDPGERRPSPAQGPVRMERGGAGGRSGPHDDAVPAPRAPSSGRRSSVPGCLEGCVAETGGVGNFVRMPYPEFGMHGKQVMLNKGGTPLAAVEFLRIVVPADPIRLGGAAQLWTDTVGREHEAKAVVIQAYDGSLDDLVWRLKPVARPLFFDGPNDGDRSRGLYRVATDARKAGLDAGEAMALVADADLRWGKYQAEERPAELDRLIQRAYR